jgi:aspartate carbamoyltransferase catalytic subunit
VPDIAATIAPGVKVTRHIEDALRGTDVVMLLRVQKERLSGLKIDLNEYIARYQMTPARVKMAKKDAIVMHPGPIIRGLELTSEVADGQQSRILEEVHNGVTTRMAILARAMGKMR